MACTWAEGCSRAPLFRVAGSDVCAEHLEPELVHKLEGNPRATVIRLRPIRRDTAGSVVVDPNAVDSDRRLLAGEVGDEDALVMGTSRATAQRIAIIAMGIGLVLALVGLVGIVRSQQGLDALAAQSPSLLPTIGEGIVRFMPSIFVQTRAPTQGTNPFVLAQILDFKRLLLRSVTSLGFGLTGLLGGWGWWQVHSTFNLPVRKGAPFLQAAGLFLLASIAYGALVFFEG